MFPYITTLLFISILYSVFKVRSRIQVSGCRAQASLAFRELPDACILVPPSCVGGLKWTRTTDLALIRRAL